MSIVRVIKEFIVGRGFTLMVVGISVSAAGVLLYALFNTPRYAPLYYPQAALGIFFLGIVTYFTGRVSVAMQRNDNKRKARELLSRNDDEDGEPPHDACVEFLPRNNDESGVK
jgi:hypothetical protein